MAAGRDPLNRNASRPQLAALVVLSLAACAQPASAYTPEGSWISNEGIPFAPLHLPSSAHVVTNHTGGVLVVVFEFVDSTAVLYAYTYALGGFWSAAVLINDTGLVSVYEPACALADDGTAVAVWLDTIDENATVRASLYTPGAGWGAPQALGGSVGGAAYGVQAAIGTDGRAMVTWTENVSGTFRARFAFHPAGQAWSAAANIDSAEMGSAPVLDAGPGGTFVAAWLTPSANETIARFARFAPGSGWSAALNVSAAPPSYFVYSVTVKAAPDGGAFVAWSESDLYWVNISARHQAAGGSWDAIRALSTSGYTYTAARMAVDGGGNATVGWIEANVSGLFARAQRFEVGFGWRATADLGPADPTYLPPVLAAADDGVVMAIWALTGPGTNFGAWARFAPGLGWSQAGSITEGLFWGEGAAVALAQGHVLLVASYSTGATALYDRLPPALTVAGPGDASQFTYPVVDVTGTTEPGARVVVNNVSAAVEASGAWAARILLGAGPNVLRVVATDRAGNSAYNNRTVTFSDPVPGLEAALAAAQANASAASANASASAENASAAAAAAAAAQAALVDAQANLTAQNARVSALEASMSSRVAEEQRLQAEMSALNQSIVDQGPRPSLPSDGFALNIAVLGVAVGAIAMIMASVARRGARARGGIPQQAEPAKGGEHDKGPPPPPRG